MRRCVFVTVLIAVHAWALPVQAAGAGTRVRITPHDGDRFIGNLVVVRADSLFLTTSTGAPASPLPLSAVRRIEESDGIHDNHRKGAWIGFAGGTAVILGVIAADWGADDSVGSAVLFSTIVGGIPGALIGMGAGKLIHTEHWSKLPLEQPLGSLHAPPPGPRASVGFVFARF